ncbi:MULTISPECIES: lysylphosphatidylglycerol synthase transmembrane domain-containing protein [Fusobacterium]|uniref:lysylphosphatidylglycerol synthase transmembrane domain-containing protein n=1 Tax=Fusobacterium TaxID=848 RepID=UPI000452FCCA|nr:lysylphosphatidylglycerol synthase transmembrane domain-containing protein [Fusobacterium sp. OBRC1]EUB33093.1 membrane protein, PF03706 family [Fusobacterium sp. OBRC1]
MEVKIFLLSIFFMIMGHIFKIKRWGLLISVYEKPVEYNLLNAMTLGHTLNTVFPIRIGDIVRIIWAGKKLKNSYSFSLATVIADLYIDFITVGAIFFFSIISRKGIYYLEKIPYYYAFIFIFIIPITFLVIMWKKYIKLFVKRVASIFNERIELSLLYITYLCFTSIKDIFQKINKLKFIFLTFGIWTSYIISYSLFAKFMQKKGENYSIFDIFSKLFSGASLYNIEKKILPYWIIYLLLPLGICLLFSLVLYVLVKKENFYYRQTLPQINSRERLAFLKTYFSNENRENIRAYLEINKDVLIIEDISAGSNASTLIVMKKDGTLFFRKYAFNDDGIKLKKQIEWIEKHFNDIPLPIIVEKEEGYNYITYDMKNLGNSIGMFKYIHTMPLKESWNILKKALEDIQRLHKRNLRESNEKDIEQYIKSKVVDNLKIILTESKYIKNLEKYKSIFVNGVELPTLRNYDKILNIEYLKSIFNDDKYSDIHGDLTIENIIGILDNNIENLVAKKYDEYYFIDPNTGNIHDSPFLDYAKLLQSLHGNYEFLMNVSEIKIEKNYINFMVTESDAYVQLYQKYYSYLKEKFSNRDIISIFFHEIIHWLRLLPYKIKKNDKLAVVFYTKLLKIIADVQEIENELKK